MLGCTFMRIGLLAIFVIPSISCTQYKPQGPLKSFGKGEVGLVPTGCAGKKEVFRILPESFVIWKLERINEKEISSKHSASGYLNTIRGALTQSEGLVTFNMQDLATGDVSRDRILRDVLFTEAHDESFRLILDKIATNETGVGAGTTLKLKMVGKLEIGGRVAPLMFDANVSEKDGVYHAVSAEIPLKTREINSSYEGFSLKDKIDKLSAALGTQFGNTLNLNITLDLKKDCQ